MKLWSAKAQKKRFLESAELIRRLFRPLLDDNAHSDKLLWWDQDRIELWSSHAFFAGNKNDAKFANTILRHVRDVLHKNSVPGPDPFGMEASSSILAEHMKKLEPDVKNYFVERVRTLVHHGMTADYQFHGYNDNMPVMWTWALTFAGDFFENREFRNHAWGNLCQLRDLLRRRGTVAEYGLGYSTHRLTGIANVANFAKEEKFRNVAKDIEARLWAEIAGHWNPSLSYICGASMRGGWPMNKETSAILYQVLGADILKPWMPREKYFDTVTEVKSLGLNPEEFIFSYPFGYLMEFASATYHVPDKVAEIFYSKPKNFLFSCTAENGYVNEGIFCKQIPVYGTGDILITTKLTDEVVVLKDNPEHGAQPHGLNTFHGKNYSLGTSTTNMFTSSHALTCTYRRTENAATLSDVGEFLIRYNINGKIPGGRLKNTYWKSPEYKEEKENYCNLYADRGRHFCIQKDNTALCLMTPEYRECWDISELRADLLFCQLEGKVKAIWIDGKKVDKYPFIAAKESRIDIDEGAVFMSIHPLIGRSIERKCAIKIQEINEFLVISLYNYEGPSKVFSPHEIAKYGNGFVIETRDSEDFANLAEFQKKMCEVRIFDQLYGGRRRVHYIRPELRISTHYCPYTHTKMFASVNGLEHEIPKLSFSNGIQKKLPFMDGKPVSPKEDMEWIETQMNRKLETYNPVD